MDTTLKGINEVIEHKYKQGDSELAFVYNIMMPDFLLFTVGMSFAFALLIKIFGIAS